MIGVIVHSFVITRANSSVEYESWIPLISATISREHLHQQQPDEKRLKIPLEQLTKFNITVSCPDGLVAMQDRHIPENSLYGATTSNRLIPRIVHQTSKSRCITQPMADIAKHWSIQDDDGTNWSYYFHDDNAMQRLFDQPWPEFPHIHDVLACIKTGTMRADLWRYLVLYEYGGIYADLDTKPAKFNASMINPTTDGFFVVEMYHIPSQW
jgi:mannosyltransferase OCH1-like enzyme